MNADADHWLAQILADAGQDVGVAKVGRSLDDGLGPPRRVAALEDAGANKHAVDAKLHHQRRVGRGGQTTGGEVDHRQAAKFPRLLHQLIGRADLLGKGHQLFFGHGLEATDVAQHRAGMAHGLHHVARARLAFGANHGRAFTDTPQRFAQVAAATDKRDIEIMFVDVEALVGRGQDLALVDEVDAQRLQDLRLDEMADTHFSHDRDADGGHDLLDQTGVRHTGHAAADADIGRHALQSHDGHRARFLGDTRVLRGNDVHDDAALEHLRQTALDCHAADFAPPVNVAILFHVF